MAAIRSKDMKPELIVRSMVQRLGYRFRLHRRDLPGSPDLVFPGRKKVIFVHGCFWHQHRNCVDGRMPGSNQTYWLPKLARNVERDKLNITALRRAGWECLVVWECSVRSAAVLARRIERFLSDTAR